jgi:hypothetical protein
VVHDAFVGCEKDRAQRGINMLIPAYSRIDQDSNLHCETFYFPRAAQQLQLEAEKLGVPDPRPRIVTVIILRWVWTIQRVNFHAFKVERIWHCALVLYLDQQFSQCEAGGVSGFCCAPED